MSIAYSQYGVRNIYCQMACNINFLGIGENSTVIAKKFSIRLTAHSYTINKQNSLGPYGYTGSEKYLDFLRLK